MGRHRSLDIAHLWTAQYIVEKKIFLSAVKKSNLAVLQEKYFENIMLLWLMSNNNRINNL